MFVINAAHPYFHYDSRLGQQAAKFATDSSGSSMHGALLARSS